MQRAPLLSALIVIMTGAANAASPINITGKYGVTGTNLCVAAPVGVSFTGTDGLTPPGGSTTELIAVEIERNFSGSGTGTATGSTMAIVDASAVSASSINFSFTYTITDGTWSSQSSGETGTVTAGPRNGQTFTTANLPALTGLISAKATTLTLATETPQVETITYSNGDTVERICARSRVLAPLP